jgi:hypothetical protein
VKEDGAIILASTEFGPRLIRRDSNETATAWRASAFESLAMQSRTVASALHDKAILAEPKRENAEANAGADVF